jgi:hypothetical protein
MPGVFINYRSGDGDYAAVLLQQELSRRLGRSAVVRASESIAPGQDYVRSLLDLVRECTVLVAVIGARWLTETDSNGVRRLDRRSDWVRRELEEAGRSGKPIIPLLVDDQQLMAAHELPDSLRGLATYQAVRMRPTVTDLARCADLIVEATRNAEVSRMDKRIKAAPAGEATVARQVGEGSRAKIRRAAVPDGPIREFFDRIHRLHRWAGEPSTRTIATKLGPGVISYGTVYAALRGPRVPRWGHVELIVEVLDGDLEEFRRLWVDARDAEDRLRL